MSQKINFKELCDIIESYKEKKVALTFHTIGDRDSVSSAYALSEYLPDSIIVTPDFITRSAERMLKELNYTYDSNHNFDGAEAIIVLDANNLDSLGKLRTSIQNSNAEILFIDHHAIPQQVYKKAMIFNDESFNSTASIVYALMKRDKFKVGKNAAKLLLYGISADSADFKNASSQTFAQISELLKITNTDYGAIISEMTNHSPAEIRHNAIRDIFRSTVEQCGKYLIIYGETRMHANEAAEMAIGLGADVSLFWSKKKEEVSISARMYPDLDKQLSIHLGKIMQDVAPIIKGSGGGHPCAAGAYGPAIENSKEAVSKILSIVKKSMVR